MITEEALASQFTAIVEQNHPQVWELLRHCYIRVINPYVTRARIPHPPYIGIYCPDQIITAVAAEKHILKDVARLIGLVDVVCLNATHLMSDPLSKLKENHPQLWLDLLWISTKSE
ncbi:hypothetical protein IQ278_29960 [Tolypothrix sp. LEGE 11397]|uniref:hypothetical protein n=1 Tax=unclassified Tolypothrix TaxID=2649714 RepID=UPI0005F8226B|nr:hypothetical protein [Tolypothrix sp. PCC 7601]MBE9086269.1 hypothetical protein [Tolypothrix sp. LEGE 11397]UYD26354.1 hypothetical protein HGR01_34560 [Tolypothrix sp. PCC 7712]UYD37837.1 hypothetical protein HG267_19945 [Tolypothrix sp. PCC 7601]BAY92392.1 hypothetical protein NIES3275_44260 [Microchaete diplosiphon NIES-3275]